jgi:hypothetical protein
MAILSREPSRFHKALTISSQMSIACSVCRFPTFRKLSRIRKYITTACRSISGEALK